MAVSPDLPETLTSSAPPSACLTLPSREASDLWRSAMTPARLLRAPPQGTHEPL